MFEYLQLFKMHRAITEIPRADSLSFEIMTPVNVCLSAGPIGYDDRRLTEKNDRVVAARQTGVYYGLRFHAVSGISDLRFKLIKMLRARR